MNTPPTRRSGRKRQPHTKYLGSSWDKNALRLLRESSESSESSGSSPSDDSAKEVESVDEDFASDRIVDPEGSSSSEDEDCVESDEDEDLVSVTSHEAGTPRRTEHRPPAVVSGLPRDVESGRSRGIAPIRRRSSKLPPTFGSEDADLKPVLHARDTWLQARDRTLPSRETLAALQRLPSEAAELVEDLALEDEDVGIATKQGLKVIDLDSARAAHYLISDAADQSIALGPVGREKLTKLDYLKPLDVSQAWLEATASQAEEASVTAEPDPQTSLSKNHGGWIINAGEKIQSLAWLPGRDESPQLLAIACRSTSEQRTASVAYCPTRSPAFYPSASYPACIQLWAFHTENDCESGASAQVPQAARVPELWITYALDAGDIRQLQWQPSTTLKRPKLLAVLSTDGWVKTPAIQVHSLPNTVFTTMCWASNCDLVLGASDGTVHIYNILDYTDPTPYLSLPLHNTYIMNIVSTFPSSTLTFIASTSAAGDLLLTDLRAPDQDRVHVPKARVPTKPLIYCPQTRSFITVTDNTGITEPRHTASLVQCHDLRHFYRSRHICKLPEMSGTATALAGSPHHPCILISNAKGSVFATNYLRSALPDEMRTRGGDGFLQTVFEFDWRPLTAAERQASPKIHANSGPQPNGKETEDQNQANPEETDDLIHSHDVRPGISRFTGPFLPQPIDMTTKAPQPPLRKRNRSHSRRKKQQKTEKTTDDTAEPGAAEVIFEEEQGVMCLEWNPNLRFAGWAAVGWGSGIVRVGKLGSGIVRVGKLGSDGG